MATYYVSSTAGGTGDGSEGDPWDLSQAYDYLAYTAVAGDTVIFEAGTYTSASTTMLYLHRSGSSGNHITVKSRNPATTNPSHAILDGNLYSQTGIAIDANYITVDGFEIKDITGSDGCAAIQGDPIHDINITRNYIHHIAATVTSSDDHGFVGIVAGTFQGSTMSYNWLIDGNILTDIGRIGGAGGAGVWNFNSGLGDDGKKDQSLYLELHDSIISNNLFYNTDTAQYGGFRGWPIELYDNETTGNNQNITIVNNTMVGPAVNTTHCWGHMDIGGAIIDNVIIANNISINPNNNVIIAATHWGGAYTITDSIIANNLTSASTMIDYEYNNTGTFSEANNLPNIADPGFTDADNYDFSLVSDSPAINTGSATYAPALDILGISRPVGAADDIGAYEYDGEGGGGDPEGNEITGIDIEGTSATVDSFTSSNDNFVTSYSAVPRNAQTFTGDGRGLYQAKFRLNKYSTASGNVVAKLYATDTGVPTGSALATSGAVEATTLSDTGAPYPWVTFTFPAPFTILTNSTVYAISLEFSGDDGVRVGVVAAGGDGGDWFQYDTVWSYVSAADITFEIIGLTYPATYKATLTTEPGTVLEDGTPLDDSPTSIATVNSTDASWWWDANTVYINPTGTSLGTTYLWQLPSGQVVALACDEGTGDPEDSINSVVTTLTNGTWGVWTGSAGATNDYIQFNATNTSLTISPHEAINGLTAFTYTIWVYTQTWATYSPRLFSKEASAAPAEDFYCCIYENGYIGAAIYSAVGQYVSAGYIPSGNWIGRWVHVAITYDNVATPRVMKIYINGTELASYSLQQTVTGTLTTSSNTLYIGNNYANDRRLNGKINKINIYNEALTSGEVATMYALDSADLWNGIGNGTTMVKVNGVSFVAVNGEGL